MYDPKCYELAEYFLSDEQRATEVERENLAQIIQDAIENWIAGEKL